MVNIQVNKEHREKIKRLHTATHILNFSAKKILGNHVWQNGSNLKPEVGTLDITHYEQLTLDQIYDIEQLANQTIFDNKKVTIEEIDRTEAEKKYGFVLYQGGAIPMKTLRIVSVLDSDIEACGGLHMEKTGGIGVIKIIETSKIQDGVIRLKYVVREFALQYNYQQEKLIKETSSIFSVEPKQIPKTASKFFEEWKDMKKTIDKLKKEMIQNEVNTILESSEVSFKLSSSLEMGDGMQIAGQIQSKKKSFELKGNNFLLATEDISVEGSKKQIPRGKFVMHIL